MNEHERMDMRRHLGVLTTKSPEELFKNRYSPAPLSLGARGNRGTHMSEAEGDEGSAGYNDPSTLKAGGRKSARRP